MADEAIKDLIEAQGKAFEQFKQANDEELKAKADGKALSECIQKTDRLNDEVQKLSEAVEKMSAAASRPPVGFEGESIDRLEQQHKAAWLQWVRKGDESGLEALRGQLQRKDDPATPSTTPTYFNVGTDSEGGYAIPIEQDRNIMRMIVERNVMRRICRVMSLSTTDYRKLVNLGGTTSGWVGETDARPYTATPTFKQITPVFGEIYANPQVTQRALDDLWFNVESELSRDVAEEFAKQENIAFFSGDGTNKPKGLLTVTMTTEADAAREFGKFQYIKTGVANNLPATNPADILLDLIYSLHETHLPAAKFLVNRTTIATMRKWKDSDQNYLWQPSVQAGEPSSIFGYPIYTDAQMPSIGANALCIAFGDFTKAYWIIDRIGIRSLRDPYTNKPFVSFYTTKRVGSMIVDSTALKFVKCEA